MSDANYMQAVCICGKPLNLQDSCLLASGLGVCELCWEKIKREEIAYGGSDDYTQELVSHIVELEAEIDRLKAGMRVTDEVNDSLVEQNKQLRAEIAKYKPRGIMKNALICIALLLCCGCSLEPKPDQKLRREIFMQCLEKLPKGPEVVKYNDWQEVVKECGDQAYYISLQLEPKAKAKP